MKDQSYPECGEKRKDSEMQILQGLYESSLASSTHPSAITTSGIPKLKNGTRVKFLTAFNFLFNKI